MKRSFLLTVLFTLLSYFSFAQKFEDYDYQDSVLKAKHDIIFDRIVTQKLLDFPLASLFPSSDNVLSLMMIFSSDGYFGFSNSNYLTLSNRYYNVMGLRDLGGYEAIIEMNGNGNYNFQDYDGNRLSSFKESYNQYAIQDEEGELFHLKFDWKFSLVEIESNSGYKLNIEKIKSGFRISDSNGNIAEIKKMKSSIWVATYSNGKVKQTKRNIWTTTYAVSEKDKVVLSIERDDIVNNFKIKNSDGMYLIISSLYDPNFGTHQHDNHHKDN